MSIKWCPQFALCANGQYPVALYNSLLPKSLLHFKNWKIQVVI